MDSSTDFGRRITRNRVFIWNNKFAKRQTRAYGSENNKLTPTSQQNIVAAFLVEQASRLDPPQYTYSRLKNFLEGPSQNQIQGNSLPQDQKCMILVDDRRDATGWGDVSGTHHSARNWDAYDAYPPEGEDRALDVCDPSQVYARISGSVRQPVKHGN